MTLVIDNTLTTESNGTPAKPRKRTAPPPVAEYRPGAFREARAAAMARLNQIEAEASKIRAELGLVDDATPEEEPKPKRARKSRPKTATAADATLVDAVVDYVKSRGNDGAKIGDISAYCKAERGAVDKALKAAVKAGTLSREGKARGTFYVAI